MTPEVRAFEYALGIFSVLIGLAVAGIAASCHRLLRHRSHIRWDPLVVLFLVAAASLPDETDGSTDLRE